MPFGDLAPAQQFLLDQNVSNLWASPHVTSECAVPIKPGSTILTVTLDFSEAIAATEAGFRLLYEGRGSLGKFFNVLSKALKQRPRKEEPRSSPRIYRLLRLPSLRRGLLN
jgi:hypothetical protein